MNNNLDNNLDNLDPNLECPNCGNQVSQIRYNEIEDRYEYNFDNHEWELNDHQIIGHNIHYQCNSCGKYYNDVNNNLREIWGNCNIEGGE